MCCLQWATTTSWKCGGTLLSVKLDDDTDRKLKKSVQNLIWRWKKNWKKIEKKVKKSEKKVKIISKKVQFAIGKKSEKKWKKSENNFKKRYPSSLEQPAGGNNARSALGITSTSTSKKKVCYSTELSEVFEYDNPIAVAPHPSGNFVAVVFLDRMKLYYVCSDSIRLWFYPIILLFWWEWCVFAREKYN